MPTARGFPSTPPGLDGPVPGRDASNPAVPALVRAARIMDLVCAAGRPLRATEIGRALVLSRSTVHVLCATLVQLGLLVRVGTTQYAIGPQTLAWAAGFERQSDLVTEFGRTWDDIGVPPEETVTLSILSGAEVVYVTCRNGTSPIGISFRAGMRLPAPYTATGKAILSTYPEAQVREFFAETWPPAMTAASVTDVDALLVELVETRARGYSVDHGQSRDGASCFGAPVFRAGSGPAVAGVAVAVLTSSSRSAIEKAVRAAQRVASRLTQRLGGQAVPPGGGSLV